MAGRREKQQPVCCIILATNFQNKKKKNCALESYIYAALGSSRIGSVECSTQKVGLFSFLLYDTSVLLCIWFVVRQIGTGIEMESVTVRVTADVQVPLVRSMVNAVGEMDPGLQQEILLEAVAMSLRNRLGGFPGRIQVEHNKNRMRPDANKAVEPNFVASIDFEALGKGVEELHQEYERVMTVAHGMYDALVSNDEVDAPQAVTAPAAGSEQKPGGDGESRVNQDTGRHGDRSQQASAETLLATLKALKQGLETLIGSETNDHINDPDSAHPHQRHRGVEGLDEVPAPPDLANGVTFSDSDEEAGDDGEAGGYRRGFSRDYDPASMGYAPLMEENGDDEPDEDGGDGAGSGRGAQSGAEGDGETRGARSGNDAEEVTY